MSLRNWFDPNWRQELTNAIIGTSVLAIVGVIATGVYSYMTKGPPPLYVFLGGGAIVGLLIGFFVYLLVGAPKRAEPDLPKAEVALKAEPTLRRPRFSVRMGWGTHYGDETNLWFVMLDSKTPIWGAQLITFTNLLPHPILIESYKVEQQFKDGPWETISIPYDLTRGKVYLGNSDSVDAGEMKYVTFDQAIQDKNIAPNESIRGWLFYNLQRWGKTRMTIDTPRGSYTEEMLGSASKGWPVQSMLQDATLRTPKVDLGKLKLSSFAHPDPKPLPTSVPSKETPTPAPSPTPASTTTIQQTQAPQSPPLDYASMTSAELRQATERYIKRLRQLDNELRGDEWREILRERATIREKAPPGISEFDMAMRTDFKATKGREGKLRDRFMDVFKGSLGPEATKLSKALMVRAEPEADVETLKMHGRTTADWGNFQDMNAVVDLIKYLEYLSQHLRPD